MKIHKYDSYDQYKSIQQEANKRKIDWVWVKKESIDRICEYFGEAEKVLCHGSRNGAEIEYFKKYYKNVIGTDISSTANNFTDTVQWDFHNTNEDWVHKFDIVYSNSLDHAYDPRKAVKTWIGQIHNEGLVFVEHNEDHTEKRQTEIDPFGASLDEYRDMFPVLDEIQTGYSTILVMR